ncbi:uncharacterized protein LOC124441186 isoform X2 [Xenia sp. Carnegie-2017]|uniref:uncharacterized protein LOC124441186 isoform X2 n=1 Tax=Xenia sp. Carnegie-2017 TaxID=2897299 RepID=UPI001F044D8B|nr:uncharacterized protein LOC124441186 isoform X2 [Xenia sp. Carnegie-2017]
MEVVRDFWLARNKMCALVEINKFLQRKDKDSLPIDANCSLLFAKIFYENGDLVRCEELLKRVEFEAFDLTQLILENNQLILKYLICETIIDNPKAIATSMGILLEKLQGLPFSDVCEVELNVCLNYVAIVFNSTGDDRLVPGGYNVCQAAIERTLCRVFGTTQKVCSTSYLVFEENIRHYYVDGQEGKHKEHKEVAMLLVIFISILMINSHVFESYNLMMSLADCYRSVEKNVELNSIFTLTAGAENLESCLLPTIHFLLSCSSFMLNKKTECLKHCDKCLSFKADFVNGLFMKALLLYESRQYENALLYLERIVSSANGSGCLPKLLNFVGCILARQEKYHSALLKFRLSFFIDKNHLEALYNCSVVYREMCDTVLEFNMWKYLYKILNARQRCPKQRSPSSSTLLDHIYRQVFDVLGRINSEDNFVIFTDISGVTKYNRQNSKLGLSSVLFKLGSTCLMLRRYSEASRFYGKLVNNINEKPVDLKKCGVSSLARIYVDFTESLAYCGRWKDCLVVCEKFLKKFDASNIICKLLTSEDVTAFDKGKDLIKIMVQKAEALNKLKKLMEAVDCYENSLDVISKSLMFCQKTHLTSDSDLEEPTSKKQKKETRGIRFVLPEPASSIN